MAKDTKKTETKPKTAEKPKAAAAKAPAAKAPAKAAKPAAKETKKAAKAALAVKKGVHQKHQRKIRTNARFYRPKTLSLPRAPKFPRVARDTDSAHRRKFDQYAIIKYPLATESAMKKIEENNTLVFVVDVRANKNQIKDAVRKLYDIKTLKVNTLVRSVSRCPFCEYCICILLFYFYFLSRISRISFFIFCVVKIMTKNCDFETHE
jgi:large subunit ribosomal protein L23Ae